MTAPEIRCPLLGAFSHVVVGVADLGRASAFWQDNFGLAETAWREGPDPELARLWGIPPGDIARQVLLATPGSGSGGLHLVEFTRPGEPVRQGAQPFDCLPKNLDVYTRDLPARYRELEAAGHRFRSPWGEMPGPDGLVFREVHLPGHDGTNVVILEVIGPGYDISLSPKHFAGIGPVVTVVPDGGAEAAFYRDVLGMATTLELLIRGPVVGLPPGSGLDLKVFGDPGDPLGRVEIIEYRNVSGANLYPRAVPPATGILHLVYRVPRLGPVRDRLREAGVTVVEHGRAATLHGTGAALSCRSPAGFRLEIHEAGD
jgi:catechol 2,3-dioxygenase-like lactoylglutathione lyase family enzyme